MTAIESLHMDFTDLVRSVDAVLTKPGYGTFTEAACNGTPVLYARRDDWPEQDCLVEWLEENACCREISTSALARGELRDDLERLWRMARPKPPVPRGAEEAARLIAAYLV
jgi:UDP:flavonoid glycosyltransferase YjiC (YdhE family)